jgi:hypothetical protein
MKNAVNYGGLMPEKKFNWRKWIFRLLFCMLLYFIIFQPLLVGELFGKWLNLLVTGFKNTF